MRRALRGLFLALALSSAVYWWLGGTGWQSSAQGSSEGVCRHLSWYKAPAKFPATGREWRPMWSGPDSEMSRSWVMMTDADREQQMALCGKGKPTE